MSDTRKIEVKKLKWEFAASFYGGVYTAKGYSISESFRPRKFSLDSEDGFVAAFNLLKNAKACAEIIERG